MAFGFTCFFHTSFSYSCSSKKAIFSQYFQCFSWFSINKSINNLNILLYHVCLRFFEIFWDFLRFFGIFWDFFGIYWEFWDQRFLGFFEIFWDFLGFFEIFWDFWDLCVRDFFKWFTPRNSVLKIFANTDQFTVISDWECHKSSYNRIKTLCYLKYTTLVSKCVQLNVWRE